MKQLFLCLALLAAGCNTITAQCALELQVTDHPEAKYRSRKVCKADGFDGSLEKTMCRSKTPLDAKKLPSECK